MSRVFACAALSAALLAATAPAPAAPAPGDGDAPADAAGKAPDAAVVRQAAEAFDGGVTAFKSRQYELAASRFEAADAAVPSPQALRQAIRARAEAGQGSRAATLAAQALERYPTDAATTQLAGDTIEKLAPLLHKVSVSCASPCVLAAGTRTIPGQATTRWVIYLDPEPTTVSASFFGDAGSKQAAVDAEPGGATDLRFEPGEATPPAAPAEEPAAKAAPLAAPAGPETSSAAVAPDQGDVAPSSGGGLPKLVFLGGLVATAGLAGVTVWSGLDTVNNPGADAVRTSCAGLGTACPAYQDGLAKETRTNVLIGVTGGVAALTLVAAILTDWGGAAAPATGRRVTPLAAVTDRGAAFGAAGRF